MEEIKVGEYVRTKKGKIAKVKTIYSEEDRIKMKNFSVKKETLINGTIKIPDVAKHSFNIIDLIEVGDYVNEEYVGCVSKETKKVEIGEGWIVNQKDIKSIVTKEKFENMEYKVGD